MSTKKKNKKPYPFVADKRMYAALMNVRESDWERARAIRIAAANFRVDERELARLVSIYDEVDSGKELRKWFPAVGVYTTADGLVSTVGSAEPVFAYSASDIPLIMAKADKERTAVLQKDEPYGPSFKHEAVSDTGYATKKEAVSYTESRWSEIQEKLQFNRSPKPAPVQNKWGSNKLP